MNGKAKSSRLLCSITSGEAAEPVLKVYDMNIKDESHRSSEVHKTMDCGRFSNKPPYNSRPRPNISGDYLLCET